jgi:hypothetical protein
MQNITKQEMLDIDESGPHQCDAPDQIFGVLQDYATVASPAKTHYNDSGNII